MTLISIPEIQTNDEATEELFNSRFDTIVDLLNGNLDSSNIADGSITESKFASTSGGGWSIPNTTLSVSTGYNKGNRSFEIASSADLTTVVSPGFRLKLNRSVTAPTQCTLLNGTNQFWNKTSPNNMTFTDDFTVSAWVKITSYGPDNVIASRYNNTSGWEFKLISGAIQLVGYNASASNYSYVVSYQAIPLNKWVHVTAQLDMSAFTATTSTSYVMIDGIDVPASVGRAGTNPTAFIQAGNLEIGSRNGGAAPLAGEIAQVAIYSGKVTQATIQDRMAQELGGTETNLVAYYKFNGSGNDSQTNGTANNLTANNSVTASTVDNPFNATEYGIITKVTSSVLTVFTGTNGTIPNQTLSSPYYSGQKAPFGFPLEKTKWRLAYIRTDGTGVTTSNSTYGAFQSNSWQLTLPIGTWDYGYNFLGTYSSATNVSVFFALSPTALTGLTAVGAVGLALTSRIQPGAAGTFAQPVATRGVTTTTSPTAYIIYTLGSTTNAAVDGTALVCEIFAECGYL